MPERDANDSLTVPSGAPHTPRVSGEPAASALDSLPPASGTQHTLSEEPAGSEPGDTLLSAGKPAERLEVLLEDRMAGIDERLRQLDARIARLEQKKPVPAAPESRQKPWLWIAFLIGLVVIFQLLRRVH
jgi:hypothetical protein